jgi:hypothetical protein
LIASFHSTITYSLKSEWKIKATLQLSDRVATTDTLLELQSQATIEHIEEERRRLREWRRLVACPLFVKGAIFNNIEVASCSLAVTTTVDSGEALGVRGQASLSHPALDRGGVSNGANMVLSRHFVLKGTARLTLINLELKGAYVGQQNTNDPANCGYCQQAKCVCNCACGQSCSYGVCGGCAAVAGCTSDREGGALRMEGSSIAILIDIIFGSNTAYGSSGNIFQVQAAAATKLYMQRMPIPTQGSPIYSCDAAPTSFCLDYYGTGCELDTTSSGKRVFCSCAAVPNGTCSVCASASNNGCETVLCDANFFNTDNIASNGCETTCAVVSNGTCTECTDVIASGCTTLLCDANFFDTDTIASNGCEATCAVVPGGTCTECTNAIASGCTTVLCDTNFFNTDTIASNGCEATCAVVPNGVCTECTNVTASGCTTVLCDTNFFNTDTIASNGCEATCAVLAGGTCTSCTSASSSGCTALSCDANFFDTDSCYCNGCEDGCPDVDGGVCSSCSDKDTCVTTDCDQYRFDVDENKISCEAGCPVVEAHSGVCTECSDIATCTKITCNQGFDDANNDATDGCETASQCIIGTLGIQGTIACVNDGVPTGVTGSCGCSCSFQQNGFSGTFCEITNTCSAGVTECTCADSLLHVKGRVSTLETERDGLLADKTTLLQEKVALESERDVLTNEKATVTTERDVLLASKTTLMRERNDLVLEINEIEVERDALTAENVTLTEKNAQLEVLLAFAEKESVATKVELKQMVDEKTAAEKEEKEEKEKEKEKSSDQVTSPSPSAADISSNTNTNTIITNDAAHRNKKLQLEQIIARRGDLIMILAGLLFFCLAVLTILCICRLTRKKPVPQQKQDHTGKFGQFIDRHHDAIKKIGHHNHAVSVQKMSRVHSQRKVQKIQKNQFHAKGRLMARLKQRALDAEMATDIRTVVVPAGTSVATAKLHRSTSSFLKKEQKVMEKNVEKAKRKEERAAKRASKVEKQKKKKKKKKQQKGKGKGKEGQQSVGDEEEFQRPERRVSVSEI